MKTFSRACLATMVALILSALSLEAAPKVLASADGEKITSDEFSLKIKESEAKQGKTLSKEEKTGLLKALLNQRLLVAEAKAKGLDKDKTVKQAVAEGTRQVLANTLFDREVTSKVQVSDDEIKLFYKDNPLALEMARASHILIKTSAKVTDDEARKKAEGIYNRVKGNPAKFAQTAREESEDLTNRDRGGDLGAFGRGAMVAEFDKAVFEAKAGDFLKPVKTQFGYHIIYVTEKRTPSLEESATAIQQELARRKTAALQQQYLDKLAKKHNAKISEDLIP